MAVDEYEVMRPDRKNPDGTWVKTFKEGDKWRRTASYQRHRSMFTRCSGSANYPAYKGCTISKFFQDFDNFANWHTAQIDYGLRGYALDKDILVHGNRVYSEHNCILVPAELNAFLVSGCGRTSESSGLPAGVIKIPTCKSRYKAQIRMTGGYHRTLGNFGSPDEAHAAYKEAKKASAQIWYERLVAGEFLVDPRVIERLRTWEYGK